LRLADFTTSFSLPPTTVNVREAMISPICLGSMFSIPSLTVSFPLVDSFPQGHHMTWIKTVPLSEASQKLLRAMEAQQKLYPIEYATPVHPTQGGPAAIVASHGLIPEALHHAFATFGVLMSPELPLSRRQHEMITTVVSSTNRCVY